MAVELHAARRPPRSTPSVGRAAYRIVQEALTNAGKHAPGARVHRRPSSGRRASSSSGSSTAPARGPRTAAGGGFGLVGLRERVRTLGGRLRAEPRLDGGFVVEAVLPA